MTLELCTHGRWSEAHCTDCTDCRDRSRAENKFNNQICFQFYFCLAGRHWMASLVRWELGDWEDYDLHALSRECLMSGTDLAMTFKPYYH